MDFIETGNIRSTPKRILVKQLGISKVIVVRTKKNGGIK